MKHELLPWAVAIFTVTTIIGAGLSIARVYSQRKPRYSPTYVSAPHFGSQLVYPRLVRSKLLLGAVMSAAVASAIVSAFFALSQ
jgi:hypothetical protein